MNEKLKKLSEKFSQIALNTKENISPKISSKLESKIVNLEDNLDSAVESLEKKYSMMKEHIHRRKLKKKK
jgi:hypothetical protein